MKDSVHRRHHCRALGQLLHRAAKVRGLIDPLARGGIPGLARRIGFVPAFRFHPLAAKACPLRHGRECGRVANQHVMEVNADIAVCGWPRS